MHRFIKPRKIIGPFTAGVVAVSSSLGDPKTAEPGKPAPQTSPQNPPAKPEAEKKPSDFRKVFQHEVTEKDAKGNEVKKRADYTFIDHTGEVVDLDKLEEKYKDSDKVVSFGFGTCELLCPAINEGIGRYCAKHPNTVNIVIDVMPAEDGKNQKTRDEMLKKIKAEQAAGGKQAKDVVVLFAVAKTPEKAKPGETPPPVAFDGQAAIDMQKTLGIIVNNADPTAHTDKLFGFDKDGESRGKKSARRDDPFKKDKEAERAR